MRYASILVVVLTPVFCLTSCVNNIEALDPCNTVNCANGAECNMGDCICTKRYKGPECREEKTPNAMTVTEMTITVYPLKTKTNELWDPSLSGPSTAPDMYLIINRAGVKKYISDTCITGKEMKSVGIGV
jgi:hypothetical protein